MSSPPPLHPLPPSIPLSPTHLKLYVFVSDSSGQPSCDRFCHRIGTTDQFLFAVTLFRFKLEVSRFSHLPETKNIFQNALTSIELDETNLWEDFKVKVLSAAQDILGFRKRKCQDWFTENYEEIETYIHIYIGGVWSVMVIVVGIGYSDLSSNPARSWLHFTLR